MSNNAFNPKLWSQSIAKAFKSNIAMQGLAGAPTPNAKPLDMARVIGDLIEAQFSAMYRAAGLVNSEATSFFPEPDINVHVENSIAKCMWVVRAELGHRIRLPHGRMAVAADKLCYDKHYDTSVPAALIEHEFPAVAARAFIPELLKLFPVYRKHAEEYAAQGLGHEYALHPGQIYSAPNAQQAANLQTIYGVNAYRSQANVAAQLSQYKQDYMKAMMQKQAAEMTVKIDDDIMSKMLGDK